MYVIKNFKINLLLQNIEIRILTILLNFHLSLLYKNKISLYHYLKLFNSFFFFPN